MASFTTSGTSGSGKRSSNQNVQRIRKKRKIKDIKHKTPEDTEVRTSSPPALAIFSEVAELAKEIVEEGNTQFSSLIGQSVFEENTEKDT